MKTKQQIFISSFFFCLFALMLPCIAFAADVDYQQCEVFTKDTSAHTGESISIQFSFDGQLNQSNVTTPDIYIWFVKDGANAPSLSVTSSYPKDALGIFHISSAQVEEGTEYYFQFSNTGRYAVEAAFCDPSQVSGSTSQKIANVEKKLSSTSLVGVETSSSAGEYQLVVNGVTYANGASIALPGLTANNVDYEIKVKVLDAQKRAVPNAKLKIECSNGALNFNKTSAIADALGTTTFQVSTNRTGEYKVYITCTGIGMTDNSTTTPATPTDSTTSKVLLTIGSSSIIVNGNSKSIDAAPEIKYDRTYVPFRALAEAFDATVRYDASTKIITAQREKSTVVMTVGSRTYTINGISKTADTVPYLTNNRTMVPVRFFAEAFGSQVTPRYDASGATTSVLFVL